MDSEPVIRIRNDRRRPAVADALAAAFPEDARFTEPMSLFAQWYRQAEEAAVRMPEAMTLATCTPSGRPSARMVLLKQFDAHGFVFFTNLDSRKSQELRRNPHAALTLHWKPLERQVRIEGHVERVPQEEAAAYFQTRPLGSQIGAWASHQSALLPSRNMLQARIDEYTKRFANQETPLPPYWGGWRVIPARIEFWQGRPNRLHDRLVFEKHGDAWQTRRLYP